MFYMHSNCLEFACANVEHLNYTKMVLETWFEPFRSSKAVVTFVWLHLSFDKCFADEALLPFSVNNESFKTEPKGN